MSYTPDDADPGDDLWLVHRRRKKREAAAANRRLLVGLGVGSVVLVGLGLMVALSVRTRHRAEAALAEAKAAVRSGGPGVPFNGGLPTPAAEGERWTHAELADYLKGRGVRCRVKPVGHASVALLFGDAGLDWAAGANIDDRTFEQGELVRVTKEQTSAEARDEAGRHPSEAFAWGRFVIEGSPRHLNPVHVALTGRPLRSNP